MKYQDAKKLKPGDKFKRKIYGYEFHSMWFPVDETYIVKEVEIDEVKRIVTVITTTGYHVKHTAILKKLEN